MKIVTAAAMRSLDRLTVERLGLSDKDLMENAGSAVAAFVHRQFSSRPVKVFCGKGANGGDGLVAARKLHQQGATVEVFLLAEPSQFSGSAAIMLEMLPVKAAVLASEEEVSAALSEVKSSESVVIDAILGTGFRPPVTGLTTAVIAAINASGAPVVSVDLPSGSEADSEQPSPPPDAIRASAIVTFTAFKPVHAFAYGHVPTMVASIGTPPDAIVSDFGMERIAPPDFRALFAPRAPQANKGDYGHALVMGGSVGKAGAAAMAGMATLRMGAGLVTVAVPHSVLATVAGFMPELMTFSLPENNKGALSILALESKREMMQGKNVIAIGPGLSRDPEAAQLARALFDRSEGPLVIDADGLNAFEGHTENLDGNRHPLVLTPHPGEMARLTGLTTEKVQADRAAVARDFARRHHAWVVLKGHRTLVAEPGGNVWINCTGNPGMATGGTGDILTGMITGLVAQFPARITQAVVAAVYLHGLAGDFAARALGEKGMVATDLLSFLPQAITSLQPSESGIVQVCP